MSFFISTTVTTSLYSTIFRHFTSATKIPKPLSKIPYRYRSQAIKQAQKAITDYLHTTRSLPFTYAEHIGKNSLLSLSDVISKIDFSHSTLSKNIQKFLRYHPINEFEFFYESIGINHAEIRAFLPANKFFFSEDGTALNAACVLSEFGFPWNKLGMLYKEEVSIFGKDPKELTEKLCRFKGIGFNNVTVISICLVFPYVLSGVGGEIDSLFDDLKRVFVDFDLINCVDENVDVMYEVCRKIWIFYDMGCKKGKIGELMGRSKNIFFEYSEEVLLQKIDFFCRLDARKEDIGLLMLRCPEILTYNLDTPVISVLGVLKHFGMSTEELKSVTQRYVLGRNEMANLPHIMKALNLHEWFFNKMMNGNHHLLGSYVISGPDEDLDLDFRDGLERIHASRCCVHALLKLNFMHRNGFGENGLTMKILAHLHGTSVELQERFNCLLSIGVDFSKLCRMISMSPKILNQKPESIKQKVNFLCQEMGSSLQYLDIFPAFLNYDLENRIKPRYRFHMWLTENGLGTMSYSIASVIATSEKNFIARIYGIHPAAPKQWFECFSYKKTQK